MLKDYFKKFAYYAGLYRLNKLKRGGFIVNYHMVVDEPNGFFPQISTKKFESQIHHLANHYHVISLEDYAKRLINGDSLRNCVVLTFDDGFGDNYTHAFPILKKLNLPATIFLISGCIDSGKAPWFILLRHAFITMRDKKFVFENISPTPVSTESPHERLEASNMVMKALQTCPNDKRIELLDRLFDVLKYAPNREVENLMLNWEQVSEMSEYGISFGAHTVTHPVLSQLNRNDIRLELKQSRQRIETRLGLSVKTFAYPVGRAIHYSSEAVNELESLGFLCAVTTRKNISANPEKPFEIPRFSPWELFSVSYLSK